MVVRVLCLVRSLSNSTPIYVRELVGRPLRVYNTADMLTEDFRLDRINIEVGDDGNVIDIWPG